MGEVAAAADTISGLRVYAWGARSVTAPAAMVTLPEEIIYDSTYGRGLDDIRDLILIVLVGQADARMATKNLAAYAAGAGAKSIKAAVDGYAYTEADSVTVTRCTFETVTLAKTDYLAALFHINITGPGA